MCWQIGEKGKFSALNQLLFSFYYIFHSAQHNASFQLLLYILLCQKQHFFVLTVAFCGWTDSHQIIYDLYCCSRSWKQNVARCRRRSGEASRVMMRGWLALWRVRWTAWLIHRLGFSKALHTFIIGPRPGGETNILPYLTLFYLFMVDL